MAPVQDAVAVRIAVPAANTEAQLAEEAAAVLAAGLPGKPVSEIVEDLLARLKKKRENQQRRGLNHWESYCPGYLDKLVKRFHAGAPLRQIVRFIALNHADAVEYANRIAMDIDLAETAVGDTYIELLKGRTSIALFYHALKMNARNLLERRATEARRCESLDGLASAGMLERSLSAADGLERFDFPSSRLEDQDPLDILLARQEQSELHDELEYAVGAVRRKGNRWVLETDWWKNSAIGQLEKRQRVANSVGPRNRR